MFFLKKPMDSFNEAYERELHAIFTRFPSFQRVGGAAYKEGIDGMLKWDLAAGHPHRAYACIHVAGTNGKGSVSHLIASVLAQAGYRVGLYTSPHLTDFRERIKVCPGNGVQAECISREGVLDFILKWKDYFSKNDLSFFEITTMMAFDWFASRKVDIAVIETGLGGRLDSTNIINPVLSVITSIGLDHCDMLGHTLGQIAAEKAGIIKPSVPVVIGERDDDAVAGVFADAARCCDAPLFDAADLFPPDSPQVISMLGEMDLKGEYQHKNLCTALAALSVLESFSHGDIFISEQALHSGIVTAASKMGFMGRWQCIDIGHDRFIADIGHNAHGLKYNFAQLAAIFSENQDIPGKIILGFVSDKDVDSALRLVPQIPGKTIEVICTNADSPRAMKASDLAEHFNRIHSHAIAQGRFRLNVCDTVAGALEQAAGQGGVIYVGGSTFVVAEALPILLGK